MYECKNKQTKKLHVKTTIQSDPGYLSELSFKETKII